MSATAVQIENQIQVNFKAIDKIGDQMSKTTSIASAANLQRELKRLWQAQRYWAAEYKKATGREYMLLEPTVIVGNLDAERKEAAAKQQFQVSKQKVLDGITTVASEKMHILAKLQDQYDISVSWKNAMFSHWTRMGAGLHARHPLIVKKEIDESVTRLLGEAQNLVDRDKLEKAWQKVSSAAKKVQWGFNFYNWWLNQLETGAKRAEAGIKISAALATLVVAAPLEIGVLGTMAVATAGEGAMQGTLLTAKNLGGGDTISNEDVKKAILETLIAGGTAGLGKGAGKMVAVKLAPRIGQSILKRAPTAEEIEFIAMRVEQYLAANSSSILKKVLQLDTEPDWNLWYMWVTPAINPIAMEMSKEPDINKLLKKP
ncbi:MAG: hypothetical protein FJW36_03515 [Acidobacteria bacterium]|nr:hypothetical protein [Acidobacteriota bacterium]